MKKAIKIIIYIFISLVILYLISLLVQQTKKNFIPKLKPQKEIEYKRMSLN